MLWLAVACVVVSSIGITPTSAPSTETGGDVTATAVLPLPSVTPTSTPMPTASVLPTVVPTSTPTPIPDPALLADQVYVYPQPLIAGDQVTFDVVPVLPQGNYEDVKVTITLPSGEMLTGQVNQQGFDQQQRVRFYWAWDTRGLSGSQIVTLTLDLPAEVVDPNPTNNRLSLPITLQSAERLAPPGPGVRWQSTEAAGVRLHYLTGSAAERDLPEIMEAASEASAAVRARLQSRQSQALNIYLLDRVLGQGGYAASDWVAISYVDRAYAPADLEMLLKHELTHHLDGGLGCDDAPTLLREGLAVMVAGGHYWPASLPRKAAVLPGTEAYIPLSTLVEDFYQHQHEIAYLEAGALLVYLEEAIGLQGVESLCRVASSDERSDRDRLSAALVESGLGDLVEVEQDWLRWLGALHPTSLETEALDLEIRYLETMRAYQRQYDRVANFRKGILFSPAAAMQAEITADFVRDPDASEAIALELLLRLAQEKLRRQDLTRASALLNDVRGALEYSPPWDGMAQDVLEVVKASLARGYEPYRVLDKPAQGGWLIYALDRADWPAQRQLWAAPDERGRWIVTGPQ